MAMNFSVKKMVVAIVVVVAVAIGAMYSFGYYKFSGKEFGFNFSDVQERVAMRESSGDVSGTPGSTGDNSAGTGSPDGHSHSVVMGKKDTDKSDKPAQPNEFSEAELVAMLADRPIGKDDAPITIYEHSSLTCPHCAKFHGEVIPKIKENYVDKGLVRIVFRDYANDGFAAAAFMLTRCVPEEKYHDFLDLLFEEQSEWLFKADSKAVLTNYALFTGLSRDEVNKCLGSQKLMDGVVSKTNAATRKYDIEGTPTAVIDNGHRYVRLVGAMGYKVYEKAIDKLLSELK